MAQERDQNAPARVERSSRRVLRDLTVVIPTIGRDSLRGCLQAIADGTVLPGELILIDQSQDTRVGAWVDEFRAKGLAARNVPSERRGIAAAMNRALMEVGSAFVAVTHDDCEPEPRWLETMVEILESEPGALVTGRVEPGGDGVVVSIQTSRSSRRYLRPSLKEDVLFPNNMGFAIEVARRIGEFDERFVRAAEDNDWGYRSLRLGIPIVYRPEPVVAHLDWRDEKELKATYETYARSQGRFYGKYLRRGDVHMMLRVVVEYLRALRRLARGVVARDSDLVANARSFLVHLMPGIAEGLRSPRVPTGNTSKKPS